MRVWLARREQTRRIDGELLGDRLDDREQRAYLGGISRASEELGDVDCIWYIRGKVALLFEVEWTAMLGEPLLRRHARIPPDESLVRFLVIAPERTELVRYKLGALAAAADRARDGRLQHHQVEPPAPRSSPRNGPTWPTWSRCSGSTR